MNDSFGCNIKTRRIKKGLSIQEVAKKAGMSPLTVLRIEKGQYDPTLTVARDIAGALGFRFIDCSYAQYGLAT